MSDEAASATGVEVLGGSFERDGYMVFDPQIAEATIDAAIGDIAAEFHAEGNLGQLARRARRAVRGRHTAISHRDEVRVQDAWIISENVREIAFAPAVLELLRDAYGREPRPFQTLNFRTGSQQRAHSDAMHFNSEPSGFMCGVWLALEDVDSESGPLLYYPGSQKLPEVTMAEVGEGGGHGDYEDFVQARIDREGLEPREATLRKGQALLWSSNLIHGGAPQRDPNRTRWSQVTHYFFEGCRYWKPLDSSQSERRYWEPAWVR